VTAGAVAGADRGSGRQEADGGGAQPRLGRQGAAVGGADPGMLGADAGGPGLQREGERPRAAERARRAGRPSFAPRCETPLDTTPATLGAGD